MKSKYLFLLLLLSVALAACSAKDPKSPEANSANATSGNSAAENKRDPKVVCAYLYDMGLTPLTPYKVSSSGTHMCLNSKSVPLDTQGRGMIFSYTATGDASSIEKVSVSALVGSRFKEAAEADEWVAKASNELWQKVFGKPLPDEIKEAILTSQGKQVKVVKSFTDPANVSVVRSPGGQDMYSLSLGLTLPK